jgi:hypothetical protein
MQTNIFNLPTPILYRCHVHRYYSGLSRVYLRVFKGNEQVPAFYVLFSDVGYFEGAVTWQGADFGIAPKEDAIELMLKVGMIGEAVLQFPDAYAAITETANLYVVRTTHSPVRMIAGSATLLPDIPDDLK